MAVEETTTIRILKEDKEFIEEYSKKNGKLQYWVIKEALEALKEKEKIKENESR